MYTVFNFNALFGCYILVIVVFCSIMDAAQVQAIKMFLFYNCCRAKRLKSHKVPGIQGLLCSYHQPSFLFAAPFNSAFNEGIPFSYSKWTRDYLLLRIRTPRMLRPVLQRELENLVIKYFIHFFSLFL